MLTDTDLAVAASRVIPGGVNSGQRRIPGLEDLVIVSTKGAVMTTNKGQDLLDFHGSFGPPILGHNDPDVDAAVQKAMTTIDNPGIGVTPPEIALAELITEFVPSAEKVLFTNSGSEATFHAVRLSRVATGRRKILKFQGCYHGWHDSVAMNVLSTAEGIGTKDLLSQGILPEVVDATLVVPFNDLAAVKAALEENRGEIAAVILEPVQHNCGVNLSVEGFLQGLRDLTREHGTILIFDEVITGFRHAIGGYQSIAGVTPDLTTMGKAMANGYPIGAIAGRADLLEMFSTTPGRPAFFAGTYNGHPAMATAAIATITKMREEPVHEHVFALGARVKKGLDGVFSSIGIDAVVSQFGSTFVTYFLQGPVVGYHDLLRNDADLFVRYRLELFERGILETPMNLKGSKISYAHTEADIDRLVEETDRAVRKVLAER